MGGKLTPQKCKWSSLLSFRKEIFTSTKAYTRSLCLVSVTILLSKSMSLVLYEIREIDNLVNRMSCDLSRNKTVSPTDHEFYCHFRKWLHLQNVCIQITIPSVCMFVFVFYVEVCIYASECVLVYLCARVLCVYANVCTCRRLCIFQRETERNKEQMDDKKKDGER